MSPFCNDILTLRNMDIVQDKLQEKSVLILTSEIKGECVK